MLQESIEVESTANKKTSPTNKVNKRRRSSPTPQEKEVNTSQPVACPVPSSREGSC